MPPSEALSGRTLAAAIGLLYVALSARRRVVAALCLVGRETRRGEGAEAHEERKARYHARTILMPDQEFDRLAPALDDAALARHFGVPESEVEAKRLDRAHLGLVDS